jgi:hypothetical protein
MNLKGVEYMKYVVKFDPDNKWGTITEITENKEEAYRIYHKIKIEVDVRPGHLYILEINNEGKERYLCNYKTGKDKDGLEIIKEIKRLTEQLMDLYDIDELRKKQSEYDKLSADIMHGIELIDFTKVDEDEEEIIKKIFQQQKVLTNVRRHCKYLIKDSLEIEEQMGCIFNNINSIERILKKNEGYRMKENKKERIKYLEKIGIDVTEYFKED